MPGDAFIFVRAAVVVMIAGHAWMAMAAEPVAGEGRKQMSAVRYEDFGAKGDGKTDDLEAIVRAHDHANKNKLPVRAKDGATYYIGGRKLTAIIQTDTDFGTAKIVIDDREVEDRNARVFNVLSALPTIKPDGVKRLTKNQPKIDLKLDRAYLLIITNDDVKHYIRKGANQDKGASQTDVVMIDKDGNVDPSTPILWDFDNISSIVGYPIDSEPLKLTGGHFTTIANQAESKYTYYARCIGIKRSNVTVDGLQYHITGEGEQGAPYAGSILISECANVTVRNTVVTAHKTYRTIGSAGRGVSMGSYGLQVTRSSNVKFENCSQTTDINDTRYWGIMASNYSKNLTYDGCRFSRFDAHKGVYNATIRDSVLGHMGVLLIGSGTFTMENTTVHAGHLVNLRGDYGSTWEGEWIIRNCVFVPPAAQRTPASVIAGSNAGDHDFGYPCHMPARIVIDKLHIDDSKMLANYPGPALFSIFNPAFTDASYKPAYGYITPREVILTDITTASGQPLRLSDNPFMFKDVDVKTGAAK